MIEPIWKELTDGVLYVPTGFCSKPICTHIYSGRGYSCWCYPVVFKSEEYESVCYGYAIVSMTEGYTDLLAWNIGGGWEYSAIYDDYSIHPELDDLLNSVSDFIRNRSNIDFSDHPENPWKQLTDDIIYLPDAYDLVFEDSEYSIVCHPAVFIDNDKQSYGAVLLYLTSNNKTPVGRILYNFDLTQELVLESNDLVKKNCELDNLLSSLLI